VAKIAKPTKRAPRPKTKILRGDKLSVEARAFFSGLAAAWKREKGGTHRELGEKTGVGSSRIDALVHGRTDVRISMIAAIAREAFGVDIKTYVLMGIVYQEQHAAEDAYNAAKERAGVFKGIVGAMPAPAPAVSAPLVEASTPA
jgi:transcriptional regulator with XRE-family HTH domain